MSAPKDQIIKNLAESVRNLLQAIDKSPYHVMGADLLGAKRALAEYDLEHEEEDEEPYFNCSC